MGKLLTLVGFGVLGVALLVSTGTSGDKKDPKDKIKGQLPAGWKNLGLSKEQVLQVYSVQTKFKKKVIALEEQIKEAKAQEKTEMRSVLTAAQKELLLKLVVGEDEPKDKKDKAPPKDDKKDGK